MGAEGEILPPLVQVPHAVDEVGLALPADAPVGRHVLAVPDMGQDGLGCPDAPADDLVLFEITKAWTLQTLDRIRTA